MPLTIRLLGAFEVQVDGQPLGPVRLRAVEWLLALLVLRPGRDVPRAWLAGTLWPGSSEANGLYNLRRRRGRGILRDARRPAPVAHLTEYERTVSEARATLAEAAFAAAWAEGRAMSLDQAVEYSLGQG